MGKRRPTDSAEGEHKERDVANRTWLATDFALARRTDARAGVMAMQADMFFTEVCGEDYDSGYPGIREALLLAARKFRRPILLLNGDTHVFVRDNSLPDAPNLTRLMVPCASDVRAVQVTLDPEATEPVALELLGDAPAQPESPPCAGYVPRMKTTRSR